jgi:hypothetical protein
MPDEIETERLDVDVEPPDDRDYVLVEKVASGGYVIRHGPIAERDDSITIAKEYARHVGLDRIFIRGF